jgi:hypothetical protein
VCVGRAHGLRAVFPLTGTCVAAAQGSAQSPRVQTNQRPAAGVMCRLVLVDLNFDKDESTVDHIMEFIKSNNHTNIVQANVPIRHDYSYYSQVNKGIISYNKK